MKGTRFALGLLAAGLLTACGGGGGGDSGGNATPTNTQLTGTASKGVLNNAIVTAYAVTNGSKGNVLGSTRTGTDGTYNLTLNGYSGAVLVELTVDNTTQMTCDAPTGCGNTAFGSPITPATGFTLQSVVAQAGGTVQAAITPFTHLAAQYAASKNGGLSSTNVSSALTQVAALFDLPPLASTQPVDITATNLGTDANAQRYAVLNAAIAQLAGGDPAQIGAKLSALATELTAHNGQLLGSTDAEGTIDLADVLNAARDVATDDAVTSKLDSLVNVVINESLTNAEALGETETTASGSTSGSSTDLDKVKAFVAQAHDLVESVLQADNDTVAAEVNGKLATISLFGADNGVEQHEISKLGDALSFTHALMLGLTQAVLVDGSSDTTLDKDEATALLAEWGHNGADSDVEVVLGNGFQISLDAANRRVTANGPLTISRFDVSWTCNESGCAPSRTAKGDPVTFTVSNLQLSYPSLTTAASQFTFGIAGNGSLESPTVKLDLSASAGSGLTMRYGNSATLEDHLSALADDDESNDAAHIPTRLQLSLNQASLIAKNAPATHFGKFTGTINLAIDYVEVALPLTGDTTETVPMPLPSLFSVAGSFSSAAGEKLEASLSLALDDNLGQQFLAVDGEPAQDDSHFAKGAFSATLKLKLGGSANLDTEVSVTGHRSSFTGGDIAIKLANNGKWLQVAATGSDLTTATSLTLSNQDGATVTIVPQHLDDDDDSNDEVELKLNGTTYGKLYELAGAWVAKFSDNSFTML